jgi:serine phosphatase RsbU (regulator of sigma subunit)
VLGARRYDISPSGDPGDVQTRYWTTTAVPIVDGSGLVTALLYNVHDVTALTQSAADAATSGRPRVRDLFRAAVEITEQARLFDDQVIAERQLGLAVQDAMLPASVPASLADRVAVRYRPASHVLHVGGDWYDVSRLAGERFTVAVGDVVGHGLPAAVVMGQLRAALNALTQANLGPADALAGLDRFARQDPAATASTALKVVIDPTAHTLTYSSAGHLPAILVDPGRGPRLLDQAQGPALALPARNAPRPAGALTYPDGARLLLYTDGLVERRGDDLDTSVRQLAGRLQETQHLPLEEVADLLLRQLPAQQADDIALVLLQL